MRKLCWLSTGALVVAVLTCFGASPALATEADDLLELVTQGTKQAALAVTSGKGRVKVLNWSLNPLAAQGSAIIESEDVYDAAFSETGFCLSMTKSVLRYDPVPGNDHALEPAPNSKRQFDFAVQGNKVTYFTRDEGPRAHIAALDTDTVSGKKVSSAAKLHMRQIRPTGLGLPGHGITSIGSITFAGEQSVASTVRRVVGRESVNGSECLVVELSVRRSDKSIADFINLLWVDPSKGFTVTRMRQYREGGPYAERTLCAEEDVEVRQYASGVWFPSRVTSARYEPNDKWEAVKTSTATVTYDPSFELNIPITAEELSLNLPSGTRVRDLVMDMDYSVP